jgi:hypothetical protein
VSTTKTFRKPIIRSMDFTDTFHQEDTVTLTEEEKKEAGQIQMEERLRRKNPLAWERQKAKQRVEQTESIQNFILTKSAGDPSQVLMDFQSSQSNPPGHSSLPTTSHPAWYSETPPGLPLNPVSPLRESTQHSFPPPASSPWGPLRGLAPIPGSNTQVQPNPTILPERIGNASPENVKSHMAQTRSIGPFSAKFKANPRFENILTREAEKMAQQGKKS